MDKMNGTTRCELNYNTCDSMSYDMPYELIEGQSSMQKVHFYKQFNQQSLTLRS